MITVIMVWLGLSVLASVAFALVARATRRHRRPAAELPADVLPLVPRPRALVGADGLPSPRD